ncbi:MAG: DUF2284 domain-containing protein [Methanomassiliicoccaceae archaeon]|nr:DUF2284 domain-containing protein [Methanomassiliicoccaceae archaeon]
MIEDLWKKMSADPKTKGYSFRKIGAPSPDPKSMKECRKLCEENLCKEYGVTWGCPPGVGTEKECLKIIAKYSKAAILIRKHENIDLKNGVLLKELGADHQDICREFSEILRKKGYEVLPLSDGGCSYCEECSYPDEPCRFPDKCVTSISGYGILMDQYLKSQNIDFEFRDDCVTLYGLILYNEP